MTLAANTCVVVVSYNGIAETRSCLESLCQLQATPGQIVVVDNASNDGTPAVIAAQFPSVKLYRNTKNLGYAAGANVGFRHALSRGAEAVLLLNNDAVVDAQALSALLMAATAHPRAGFFGAKIYYRRDPQRLWYAGSRWRSDLLCFEHIGKDSLEPYPMAADSGADRPPSSYETDYACGCALLVRAAVLKKVGLMDPRFFLSYEEADWCFRARAEGYASLVVPAARVWHSVSAAFGGERSPLRLYYDTRNALLFGERHLPEPEYRRLFAALLSQGFPSLAGLRLQALPLRALPALILRELRRVRHATAEPASRARYLGLRDYVLRRFYAAPSELDGGTASFPKHALGL